MIKFYQYPKCTTCKKASKWLTDNEVPFDSVNIVENTPTASELKEVYKKSKLPIKRFFNTSGQKYRELGLKDKVDQMTDDDIFALLATDGMLIKRPLAFDDEKVTLGFKEDNYENYWN